MSWLFDEFSPVGVELSTVDAVAAYDRNQGTDSTVDDALLDRLAVGAGTCLVDLACGTGSFAVRAAARGAVVHAVDVSPEMLAFTRRRATAEDVRISTHHAGFLSYVHSGTPADVVSTKSALHQLPDAWKQEALLRIAGMLRPGGTFYLWDLMFSFAPAEFTAQAQRLVEEFGSTDGTGFSRTDFETHLREEFSTYTWILEGMLRRAGFEIVSSDVPRPTHGEFVCRRV